MSEREILLPTQKFLVATRHNGSALPVIPERRCRRQQQRRLGSGSISPYRIRNSFRLLNSYTPNVRYASACRQDWQALDVRRKLMVGNPDDKLKHIGHHHSLKCGIDRVTQRRIAEWLEQARRRTLFEHSRTNSLVSLSGDEDDRHLLPAILQFLLKLRSSHPR